LRFQDEEKRLVTINCTKTKHFSQTFDFYFS
jgi:hypothetical protein